MAETLQIKRVIAGPEHGRPYDSKHGMMYPIEFICDGEYEGKAIEKVKVTISSKKADTEHPLESVIKGCGVVAVYPPRDFRGQQQFNVNVSESKDLNGMGFGGNRGGGGHSGGGGSSVGMEVGAAMHDAAALVSGTLKPGCSVTELEEVLYATAKMCLRVSQKLKDEATPNTGNSSGVTESGGSVSAGGHNDKLNAIREALKGYTEIQAALNDMGADKAKALCMETWEESGGNARLFLQNMDSALFPPEPTTADEVNDSMPF
jgi:hypothetical protein